MNPWTKPTHSFPLLTSFSGWCEHDVNPSSTRLKVHQPCCFEPSKGSLVLNWWFWSLTAPSQCRTTSAILFPFLSTTHHPLPWSSPYSVLTHHHDWSSFHLSLTFQSISFQPLHSQFSPQNNMGDQCTLRLMRVSPPSIPYPKHMECPPTDLSRQELRLLQNGDSLGQKIHVFPASKNPLPC